MLRNRQNSTKFRSLTEDDEKIPYEEMGTLLVVVFLASIVLVELLIEYGPDNVQHTKNCICKNVLQTEYEENFQVSSRLR